MILALLFDLLLGLVDFLVNLIPNVSLDFDFNFTSTIAHVFRYANVVIRLPVILSLWAIALTLDHFNFVKKLFFLIKSFIPFLGN